MNANILSLWWGRLPVVVKIFCFWDHFLIVSDHSMGWEPTRYPRKPLWRDDPAKVGYVNSTNISILMPDASGKGRFGSKKLKCFELSRNKLMYGRFIYTYKYMIIYLYIYIYSFFIWVNKPDVILGSNFWDHVDIPYWISTLTAPIDQQSIHPGPSSIGAQWQNSKIVWITWNDPFRDFFVWGGMLLSNLNQLTSRY